LSIKIPLPNIDIVNNTYASKCLYRTRYAVDLLSFERFISITAFAFDWVF